MSESLLNNNESAKQGSGDEISILKNRIKDLEDELQEARKIIRKHSKENEEVEVLKNKSEDTMTKAKGIIFEQTRVVKNQELQLEALNQQVTSLKDVVSITKDLLQIRNMEVTQLETKIRCMEDRYNAEKERHDLIHQKLEQMIRYNGELRREYEAQLCLFTALRQRYNEKELAVGVVDSIRTSINAENTPNVPTLPPNTEISAEGPDLGRDETATTVSNQNENITSEVTQPKEKEPTDTIPPQNGDIEVDGSIPSGEEITDILPPQNGELEAKVTKQD